MGVVARGLGREAWLRICGRSSVPPKLSEEGLWRCCLVMWCLVCGRTPTCCNCGGQARITGTWEPRESLHTDRSYSRGEIVCMLIQSIPSVESDPNRRTLDSYPTFHHATVRIRYLRTLACILRTLPVWDERVCTLLPEKDKFKSKLVITYIIIFGDVHFYYYYTCDFNCLVNVTIIIVACRHGDSDHVN